MITRVTLRGLLVALVGLAALGASPAAADVRKDFFQFNACGNICNHGDQDEDSVVEAIKNSVNDSSQPMPHALTLNELCVGQYEELKNELGSAWEARFAKHRDHVEDCNGTDKRFGIAVFTRGNIIETDTVNFTNQASGDEQRKLLCAKVDWARQTRVCATHLTNQNDRCPNPDSSLTCRWWQAAEVEDKTNGYLNQNPPTPVVVGGDFNTTPGAGGALDHMYADWINPENTGHGRFKEVDQGEPACRCGEWTHDSDRKIDYVFVSQGQWNNVGGDATTSPWSDHDPLRGHATLETP